MGPLLAAYLAVGLVTAMLLFMAVRKGLDRSEHDPEWRDAMNAAEPAVRRFPGGMPTLLISVVLFWPVFSVIVIKHLRDRRGGNRGRN